MNDSEVRERVARVEELLGRIASDPAATEVLQAVVELYGEALRRVVAAGPPSELLEDELISQLLLLHDLHPDDAEKRVARALEEVRPYLGSHGGDVELLGVTDGVARVRLHGTCNGCPSSTATLKSAIEQAVQRAAPELQGVEAEDTADPQPQPVLIPIGSLQCPTELRVS
jgi:Fe-S cluster biogenesis protein NfuA